RPRRRAGFVRCRWGTDPRRRQPQCGHRTRQAGAGAMTNALPAVRLGRRWDEMLEAARPQVQGRLSGVVGLSLRADGVAAAIGDVVEVHTAGLPVLAEVVAVRESGLECMPLG